MYFPLLWSHQRLSYLEVVYIVLQAAGRSSCCDFCLCVVSIFSAVEGSCCTVYLLNLLCTWCVPVLCHISLIQ